jgi:pimeloyl-ACP methyl ester carboxylesterase
MQVIVDEHVVGYDRTGHGPIVVLLHGWGAHRGSMAILAKELAERYDVVSVDVPGFGESERPDSTWSLANYAEWLTLFLDKLNISKVYGLIGHSNGGAIAIKAVGSGLAVNRLILLGASGIRNRENGKKLLLQSAAKAGKIATRMLPQSTRMSIRKKWYKKIGSELYDRQGMESTFKKVVAEDLLVDAAMIPSKTLLLYGSEDKATPPTYGQLYQKVIEDSELHIIESAGHYSFIDQPKAVTEYIEKFLL